MDAEKYSTTDSFSNSISETYSDFNLDVDNNPETIEEPINDSFHANLNVLQARLALAEAKDAVGKETDHIAKVLKARKALAEAKQAIQADQDAHSTHLSTDQTTHQYSDRPQIQTASRSLKSKQPAYPIAKFLQFSSSICAVTGGVLLSSNTSVSKYGFILLACSSSQIFLSSLILKQKHLMIYGASLFLLVDCLGIYRWLLQG